MSQRNYRNLIGERLGDDLEVYTILRYQDNEPVWGATCGKCASSGIAIPHRLYRQGGSNIRCPSSICGKSKISAVTSSAAQVIGRDGGWAAYYSEQLKQQSGQPQIPNIDGDLESRKAKRIAEQKRYAEIVRNKYVKYKRHGFVHEWNLDKMLSWADWCRIAEQTMDEILEKQDSGYYDRKQENN